MGKTFTKAERRNYFIVPEGYKKRSSDKCKIPRCTARNIKLIAHLQTCLAYGGNPKYYKAYLNKLTSESEQLKKQNKSMLLHNMKSSASRASVATIRQALNK